MKKYELTNETRKVEVHFKEVTLHRIKAIKNFGNVKAGDLGGWIEKEENLSHKGNAWVFDNAVVIGNAEVYGNARVLDNAVVYENARVLDNAVVSGNAKIYGDAKLFENAEVWGNSRVRGYARIYR